MEIFVSLVKNQEIFFKSEKSLKYYRFWNSSEDHLRKNSIKQLKFAQTYSAWKLLKKWRLKKYELMKNHCRSMIQSDHIFFRREPLEIEKAIEKLKNLDGNEMKKSLVLEILEEKVINEYFSILESHLQNTKLIHFQYLSDCIKNMFNEYLEDKMMQLNLDLRVGIYFSELEIYEYFIGYIYKFIFNLSVDRKIVFQNFKTDSGKLILSRLKEEILQKEFRKYKKKKMIYIEGKYYSIEEIMEEELKLILNLIDKKIQK